MMSFLLMHLEGILNLFMFEKIFQKVLTLLKSKIRKNAPACAKFLLSVGLLLSTIFFKITDPRLIEALLVDIQNN